MSNDGTFFDQIQELKQAALSHAQQVHAKAMRLAKQGRKREALDEIDRGIHAMRSMKLRLDADLAAKRNHLTELRNKNRQRAVWMKSFVGHGNLGRAWRSGVESGRRSGSQDLSELQTDITYAGRQAKSSIDGWILELRQAKSEIREMPSPRRAQRTAVAASVPTVQRRPAQKSPAKPVRAIEPAAPVRRKSRASPESARWNPEIVPRIPRPDEWRQTDDGAAFLEWEAKARKVISTSAMRSKTLWRKLDALWEDGEKSAKEIGAAEDHAGSWFSPQGKQLLEELMDAVGATYASPPEIESLPEVWMPDLTVPRGSLLYRTIFPDR